MEYYYLIIAEVVGYIVAYLYGHSICIGIAQCFAQCSDIRVGGIGGNEYALLCFYYFYEYVPAVISHIYFSFCCWYSYNIMMQAGAAGLYSKAYRFIESVA